jgi:ABC-type phosphate transport system substrate-binding protein
MAPFHQMRVSRSIVLVALLLLPLDLFADVLVVTSANSPLTALSKKQISEVFLGKVVSLPDGSSSTLIDQPDSSPLREEFYMKVTNRTAAQAKAHWAKLYFTGRGEPPLKGKNEDDVKKLISSIPGAIGYIERSSLDPRVKILFVVP